MENKKCSELLIKNCNKSEISEKFSELMKKITTNLRSQIFDKKN